MRYCVNLNIDQHNYISVLNVQPRILHLTIQEAAALRKKEKKAEDKKGKGWFSGWFGSSKKSKKEDQAGSSSFLVVLICISVLKFLPKSHVM